MNLPEAPYGNLTYYYLPVLLPYRLLLVYTVIFKTMWMGNIYCKNITKTSLKCIIHEALKNICHLPE